MEVDTDAGTTTTSEEADGLMKWRKRKEVLGGWPCLSVERLGIVCMRIRATICCRRRPNKHRLRLDE